MTRLSALLYVVLSASVTLTAQTSIFREKKWGIRSPEGVIISAVYDTIFNFEPEGKVCLACFRVKGASGNKFFKVTTVNYSCTYLNKKSQMLTVKNDVGDTTSVFSLGKSMVKNMNDSSHYFTVSQKGKKHFLTKDFEQLTFKGYYDVMLSKVPGFYLAWQMNEVETVFCGLIDKEEHVVVPFLYSDIRVNSIDSLIMACSAGVRESADDDIYDFSGKKAASYHRHVELATREFIIHKLVAVKDDYIIYDLAKAEEKPLHAEEVQPFSSHEILVRIKHEWYLYDMKTGQKKLH
jgi:hypothetical protein